MVFPGDKASHGQDDLAVAEAEARAHGYPVGLGQGRGLRGAGQHDGDAVFGHAEADEPAAGEAADGDAPFAAPVDRAEKQSRGKEVPFHELVGVGKGDVGHAAAQCGGETE